MLRTLLLGHVVDVVVGIVGGGGIVVDVFVVYIVVVRIDVVWIIVVVDQSLIK